MNLIDLIQYYWWAILLIIIAVVGLLAFLPSVARDVQQLRREKLRLAVLGKQSKAIDSVPDLLGEIIGAQNFNLLPQDLRDRITTTYTNVRERT